MPARPACREQSPLRKLYRVEDPLRFTSCLAVQQDFAVVVLRDREAAVLIVVRGAVRRPTASALGDAARESFQDCDDRSVVTVGIAKPELRSRRLGMYIIQRFLWNMLLTLTRRLDDHVDGLVSAEPFLTGPDAADEFQRVMPAR